MSSTILDFCLMVVRRAMVFLSGIIFTKLSASGLLDPAIGLTAADITQACVAVGLLLVSIIWSVLKKYLENRDSSILNAIKNVIGKPAA